MLRRPPRSTRTDTLFPYTTLFRSGFVPNDTVSGSGTCRFTGIPGLNPDPYPVENFGNSRGGTGTITQQTLRSSNCAYVRLGQIVGIDKVVTQRSEEHTSELQSLMRISYAVFCLKKKKKKKQT